MLHKEQIKRLKVGEYPNHKLFGTNNHRKDKDGKLVPEYLNRRQQRRNKYVKIKLTKDKRVKIQIVNDRKAIERAIEEGRSIYGFNGKLRSDFKKKIYHYKD